MKHKKNKKSRKGSFSQTITRWLEGLDIRHKIILTYFVLALFYTIILGIFLVDWFNSLPFFLQFVLGTIPVFALFSIALGGLRDWKKIVASFILFFTSDVVVIPLMVSPAGVVGGALLSGGASDIFLADIAMGLGASGLLLYVLTYIVFSTVLVSIAVFLLPSTDLKKKFKN